MTIIAYSYEADIHCVECAKKRFVVESDLVTRDEHGLPVNVHDREGNHVHPIFSTDEQLDAPFCGDCHAKI